MSFSADVKNETARDEPAKKCCQLAELAGFIRVCGSIKLAGGGRMSVTITTENSAVARHFKKMMKSYFGAQSELVIGQTPVLKKGHVYELTVGAEMNAEQILRETGILLVREGSNYISDGIFMDLIKTKCCKKSYLKGMFLGAGSITSPEKEYHFEIVCNSEQLAQDTKKLIGSFGLTAKSFLRKNSHVVYLKESESITDLLNILGAHTQLLDFENTRILKEMRNKTNRIMNCDSANLDKTVNAALAQLAAIEKIKGKQKLTSLPDKLYQAAMLRLENPEASLSELAELSDPPIGKSGINHRLKKIEELAQRL